MAEFSWHVEEEGALSVSVLGCSVEKPFKLPARHAGSEFQGGHVCSASDLHIPFQNTTPWQLRPVEV